MHAVTSSPGKVVLLHALLIAIGAIALCASRPSSTADAGTIVGDRWVHLVSAGETWGTIGARVGVAPAVLAARNQRTLRVPPRSGDLLAIDNRHVAARYERDELVINVPQRMLFHYWGSALRAQYPVAVGRPDWPTPFGGFTVVAVETDPTWDVPLSIQEEMRRAGKPVLKKVPPGRTNPLGQYWIGLSLGSVGVHGTIAPSSIYEFATHGCIRLHREDIADLVGYVGVGDPGRVIYEPVLVGYDGADVFLEVHKDSYHQGISLRARAWQLLEETGLRALADPELVERVVRDAEGVAIAVSDARER